MLGLNIVSHTKAAGSGTVLYRTLRSWLSYCLQPSIIRSTWTKIVLRPRLWIKGRLTETKNLHQRKETLWCLWRGTRGPGLSINGLNHHSDWLFWVKKVLEFKTVCSAAFTAAAEVPASSWGLSPSCLWFWATSFVCGSVSPCLSLGSVSPCLFLGFVSSPLSVGLSHLFCL